MRKEKIRVLLAAPAILLSLWNVPAGAAAAGFVFSLSQQRAAAGDMVSLQLSLSRPAAVAGFRVRVSCSSSDVVFAGTELSAELGEDTVHVNAEGTPVAAVYVCNTQLGRAPELSGTPVVFLFRVSGGAPAETAVFHVQADQVCDYDGKDLAMDTEADLSLRIDEALPSVPAAEAPHGDSVSPPAAESSVPRESVSSGKTGASSSKQNGSSASGAENPRSSASRAPDAGLKAAASGTASGKNPAAASAASESASSAGKSAEESSASEKAPIILAGNDASAQLSAVLAVCLAALAAGIVVLLAARKRKR